MKSQLIHRGNFIGFGIVAVLFLALYTILAVNSRPAADDFYFLDAVQTKGVWNTALEAYNTWITRWSTLLFLGFSIKLFSPGSSLLWFHLVTLLILIIGTGLAMQRVILIQTRSSPGFPIIALYAILFSSAFFLLTFRTGETWFWFTSVCMYLWPVIVLVFGIYLLLTVQTKAIHAATLTLCFLFIGGGSEVVALESLLFLCFIFAKQSLGKQFPFSEILNKRAILFAIAALTLSLFIAWIGPGRTIRHQALADVTWDQQLVLPVKATGYFLLMQLPLKIHWMLFFTVPWLILKNLLIPAEEKPVAVVFKSVFRDFIIFLVAVFIHFLIVTALLKSFPPFRTWISLSFAVGILCAVTGWRLGYLVTSAGALRSASVIFTVVSCLLMIQILTSQLSLGEAYSKAFDDRMVLLKSMGNKKDQVLEVKPLPNAGMLYSAEISSDTSFFTNKHLRDYLDLKSPVRTTIDH